MDALTQAQIGEFIIANDTDEEGDFVGVRPGLISYGDDDTTVEFVIHDTVNTEGNLRFVAVEADEAVRLAHAILFAASLASGKNHTDQSRALDQFLLAGVVEDR